MFHQIRYGLSVHSWPSGHTIDSEEAIEFTELENINCMVEKYPLEKCNDAFGESSLKRSNPLMLTFNPRRDDEGNCKVQGRDCNGIEIMCAD
jgi:hypothetical protein